MPRRAVLFIMLLVAGCAQADKVSPADDGIQRKILDAQIAELRGQMEAQTAAMKQYKDENRVDEIAQGMAGERERLAEINAEGVEAQRAWEAAAANAEQVRVWVAAGKFPDAIDIVGEEERDEKVLKLKIEKARLQGLRDGMVKKGEDVGDLDDKIAEAERAIVSRRTVVDSETSNRLLAAAQGYAARARERVDALLKERDAETEKIDGMEKVQAEYRAMEGEFNEMVGRMYELQNAHSR